MPIRKSSFLGEGRPFWVLNGGLSSEQRQHFITLSIWTSLTTVGRILCSQERDLHWSSSPWSRSAEEALPGHNLLADCGYLCSYLSYQQFLPILECFSVASPLPLKSPKARKAHPVGLPGLWVSVCFVSDPRLIASLCLSKDPQPLNANAPCTCWGYISSLQPSYLQKTQAEPACSSLYPTGILPSRNSVNQLQFSHFHNFKTSIHGAGKPEFFKVNCLDIIFCGGSPIAPDWATTGLLWGRCCNFPMSFHRRNATTRIFFRFPYTLSFFETSHFFGFNIQLTFICPFLVFLKQSHFHVDALDEIPLFKFFPVAHMYTQVRETQ